MQKDNNKNNLIVDNVDIVDVISSFLSLQKKGNNYWGVCPFHEDNKPSMSVSPEKRIFNCFSCGTGGNVITFLMKKNNWSVFQSFEFLNKNYNLNLDLSEYKKNQKEYSENEKKLIAANYDASVFYSLFLEMNQNPLVKNFLNKRFLTKEIIQEFGIGYAPEEGIVEKMVKKHHDLATLINASIANDQEKDFFRNRIMFSIKNEEGKIVGFSGRTLESKPEFAKYINSAENSLFKKSQILYNYHNAINFLDKDKRLYICEGFMDVIALYRDGIKNAVALMGTALTKEHIQYLKNKKIVLILDGDKAGMNATKKSLLTLLENKVKAFVIDNPTSLDPDEYLNTYGESSLKDLLNTQETSGMEFIYKHLKMFLDLKDFNSVKSFKYEMWNYLKHLDIEEKNYYKERIFNELKISFDLKDSDFNVPLDFNIPIENNFENNNVFQNINKEELNLFDIFQKRILNSVLTNPQLVKTLLKQKFEFQKMSYIKIFDWIKRSQEKKEFDILDEKYKLVLDEIAQEKEIAQNEADFLELINLSMDVNINENAKKVVKYIEKNKLSPEESINVISDLIKQKSKKAKEKEERGG